MVGALIAAPGMLDVDLALKEKIECRADGGNSRQLPDSDHVGATAVRRISAPSNSSSATASQRPSRRRISSFTVCDA
jgi:hypothetical protein